MYMGNETGMKNDMKNDTQDKPKTVHATAHFDFDGSCDDCAFGNFGYRYICRLGKLNVECVPEGKRHEHCSLHLDPINPINPINPIELPSDPPALIAQSTILLNQLTQALTLLGEQNKFRGALLRHCVGLLDIAKEYAPSGYAPIIEDTLRLIQEDAKIIRGG